MDFRTEDYYYWILYHRLLQHTSRCVGHYAERKIALFLRGIPRSFCHYQIPLSEEEQNHIRNCPISSVDFCDERELCKKSFDKIAALRRNQNFRIKRFDCLEKDVVSPEWKVARLFMPYVNRKSTGPENADISSLCHLLLNCDLFLDPIRRRESVEKIRDIRNQLAHRPDLSAPREDVEALFANMNSLFNDMSQDPDFDKALQTEMRRENEVLKEVYESLQQEETILLRCEEMLFKEGPNFMSRLLEMNVQLGKTERINHYTVNGGERKHQPEITNHDASGVDKLAMVHHPCTTKHNNLETNANNSDQNLLHIPKRANADLSISQETTFTKNEKHTMPQANIKRENILLRQTESISQRQHSHSTVNAIKILDNGLPKMPSGTSIDQQTTDAESNKYNIPTSDICNKKSQLGQTDGVAPCITNANIFKQGHCESNSKPNVDQPALSGFFNNSSGSIGQFYQQGVVTTERIDSASNANSNSDPNLPDSSSGTNKPKHIALETAASKIDKNQPKGHIQIPQCLKQILKQIKRIVFVDLDNWPKFFHKLPENLPREIFVRGFHGLKRWRPPETVVSYGEINKEGKFHLQSCGNTKDAADAFIIAAVIKMDSLLPEEITFVIVSGDHIFKALPSIMEQSARPLVMVDPHTELKQCDGASENPKIEKEEARTVAYKRIYDTVIN